MKNWQKNKIGSPKYNKIKKLLEDADVGDIFISRGTGLLPLLICFCLKTKYSHTFAKVSKEYFIEANDLGVSKVHIDDMAASLVYVERLGFPTNDLAQKQAFVGNLTALLGAKYDYTLLIGDLLSRVIHRSRKHPGLFNHKDKYVCSEVIAVALQKSGIKLQFPSSQMTPEDIYYLVKYYNKG